ncbi:MAG: hypothetical protein U0R52_11595 [Solirubrobacterales bacterium]
MSAGPYLLGVLGLAIAAGCAGLGAVRVRRRLLSGWVGPPAWVADGVLALALLILVAEVLGTFGGLRPAPFVAVSAAAGLAARFLVAPPDPGSAASAPPSPGSDRAVALVALAAAALVLAHWSVGTRDSLAHGMSGYDTLWYHGPFAVEFSRGSTFDFLYVAPRYLTWFFPANSELINAFGILTLGRDTLSVLLNLFWVGPVLLAAWAVGRPFGAAPHSMLGVAVLLETGVMADQAGSGRNDMAAIFFLLAAAAVLLNAAAAGPGAASRLRFLSTARPGGEDGPFGDGGRLRMTGELPLGALAVAGLAVGLMAGTKVNLLAPALALVVGLPLIAGPGRRLAALGAFTLPALAGGGYWYLRNLVHEGSPLPWVTRLAGVSLPGPDQPLGGRPQFSIAHYLTDGTVWSDWFLPKLSDGLGVLWPLLVALAVFVTVACLARGPGLLRVLAVAVVLGAAGWLFHGTSAEGPPGEPIGFLSSLRHVAPVVALALALAPLSPGLRSARGRLGLLVGLLVLLPFAAASGAPWIGGYLGSAIAVGLAAFGLLTLALLSPPLGGRALAAVWAVALLALAGGVWALQRSYLDDRYRAAEIIPAGLSDAARWARGVEDTRIATTSDRSYPLLGTDLSNTVDYLGRHHRGTFRDIPTCRQWRRALDRGDYRYAVVSYDRIVRGLPAFPPEARWTASDPAAKVVLRRRPTVVFRIDGRLDPATCPPPRPGERRLLPDRNA